MTPTPFDLLVAVPLLLGTFLMVVTCVGLLRFPDTLTRLHALTKADNLGLGLIVLGLLPQSASMLGPLKLVCLWLIAQVSGAVVSQLIAGAIRDKGLGS